MPLPMRALAPAVFALALIGGHMGGASVAVAGPLTARTLETLDRLSDPQVSPDGRLLYFSSGRSGSDQVWRTDTAGGAATQVTRLPLDVGAFRLFRVESTVTQQP